MIPEDNFDLTIAENKGYYAFPPIGLLSLAKVAREIDPNVRLRVLDLNYEMLKRSQSPGFNYKFWQDYVYEQIKQAKSPHIGITCMFGTTKPVFIEVTQFIKKHFPQVPILSGGVQATYDYEEFLQQQLCDMVFRRESEIQFRSYMKSAVAGKAVSVPMGSAFQIDGKVHELGELQNSEDVPVDWDIRELYKLIPIQDYHNVGSLAAFSRYNGREKSFSTVLSNRGCRARCTFCTVRDFNGYGIRQRPVQSVIDEVKFLVKDLGIKQIDWLDDDLLWDPKRTVELFKGLTEQVPGLEWVCNNGLIAVAITEEIMDWMAKSGMKAFKIGIESGNDEMLTAIKKPTTKPKLREKRVLFRKYPDIFVSANFIIGFPNETYGQMQDTFDFACELEWDWSSMYICQPLKGTDMFSAFRSLGDERCDVESYDKTLNPGRASKHGEFGFKEFQEGKTVLSGRDIFKLPKNQVPSQQQLKEVWFTFNLIANFIDNYNFKPGGNPSKIVRWFESIYQSYPYDASMCAALAKGYRLMGDNKNFKIYQEKFKAILKDSQYWQWRVQQFPELLEFAEVPSPNSH